MAMGEWISVQSSRELYQRQIAAEAEELETAPAEEREELALIYVARGMDEAEAIGLPEWLETQKSVTREAVRPGVVLPPTPEGRAAGADYRVRIFSPGRELPFAGHPTLGTCHAWLAHGGQPREAGVVRQECAVGVVALRRADGIEHGSSSNRWAFAAPAMRRAAPELPSMHGF